MTQTLEEDVTRSADPASQPFILGDNYKKAKEEKKLVNRLLGRVCRHRHHEIQTMANDDGGGVWWW